MICLAKDKNLIKDLCSIEDSNYKDYYFNNIYDKGKHYILKEENMIISYASSFKMAYMLNSRMINVSMIANIYTNGDYRQLGYMHKLLKEIIDQLSRQELVTITNTLYPYIFESLGFEKIYSRKTYYFNHQNFKITETKVMVEDINLEDCLKSYALFTKHFNGFEYRNINDFELLIKRANALDQYMVMVYDNQQIKGYFIFRIEEEKIIIEECIYLDTKTLTKIISYALKLADNVELELSEAEDLEKIYGPLKYDIKDSMMARINDYELFNHLYDSNVDNVKDGFEILNKPLYMLKRI